MTTQHKSLHPSPCVQHWLRVYMSMQMKLVVCSQATERDLEEIFLPVGEIVELYILRNNNGKSRGCAFVTYANQLQAQQAITQLNGRHVRPLLLHNFVGPVRLCEVGMGWHCPHSAPAWAAC